MLGLKVLLVYVHMKAAGMGCASSNDGAYRTQFTTYRAVVYEMDAKITPCSAHGSSLWTFNMRRLVTEN